MSSATVKALGLGWQVQLAESNIRACIASAASNARYEIRQISAVARLELKHNVKVIFGR